MTNFATVDDLIARWKPLDATQIAQAETILTDCSSQLRVYAHNRGLDLDAMIEAYEPLRDVAREVTVSVVKRYMCNNTDGPAMSQISQSALGYSMSGTYLVPGGGLFIKNAELRSLGIIKQRCRTIEVYGNVD